MFEILDIVLLCLLVRRHFFWSTIQISTKYYKSASDRQCGHVKICNTRQRAQHFFFGYSTKAEKIPCLFGQCLWWEENVEKDRASDYTRWLTAKKFCLHCEFSTFFHAHTYIHITSAVACIILFRCNNRTYTQQHIIAFLSFAVPFWCYCCFAFFFISNTKYNKTWWMFDDSVYHVRSWYMENQKRNKMPTVLHFYMITTIDNNNSDSNKKEHCRKIYWLGRQRQV